LIKSHILFILLSRVHEQVSFTASYRANILCILDYRTISLTD